MGISLTVIICLLTGSLSLLCASGNKGDNTPLKLTAYQGGIVTIRCMNPKANKSSTLRFCKEDEKSDCSELISTYKAPVTQKDRYTLADDKQHGVFNLTITQVTREDAGKYRCEVQTSEDTANVYSTEIHLQVIGWDAIPTETISGHPGGKVRIDCQYPDTHKNNSKFLCKGQNPFRCEKVIQTTEMDRYVENGRFKTRDSFRGNHFYVHINDLSSADSGIYWCGSDPTWQQTEFQKILLSVDDKHNKSGLPKHSTPEDYSAEDERPDHPENKSSLRGLIGGVAGFLVLSLILGVVLLLFRNKIPWTQARGPSEQMRNTGQNTEGNNEEPHYEEIQDHKASPGDTVQTVYATVNLPADQLHYATISVQEDPVSDSTDEAALPDANKNGSSSVMIHPPAADQTVYSTVSMPGEDIKI